VRSRDGAIEFEITLARGAVDGAALEGLATRVRALGGAIDVAPARVAGRLPVGS
jgi:hypothetical protein